MSATATSIINDLSCLIEPFCYEILFAAFFLVGWCIVSTLSSVGKKGPTRKFPPRGKLSPVSGSNIERHTDIINEAFSEGRKADVVCEWRRSQADMPAGQELLRLVVWSLASESPNTVVEEVVQHLETHRRVLNYTKCAAAVMDALSTSCRPPLMDAMLRALRDDLHVFINYQVYEALLGGYAVAGDVSAVRKIVSEIENIGQKLTARGHALIVKGFLQRGLLDQALEQARAMRAQGFYVPPFAMCQLFKVASAAERCPEIFATMREAEVALPIEALEAILEDCAKRTDGKLTAQVADVIQTTGVQMSQSLFGALLKAKVALADVSALDLFEEVQILDMHFSDAFYVSLMARCAEPKFLRFAEELARVLRVTGRMMVSTYSALMKVYAHCGLYGKACDLYDELLANDLQPDQVITTCLMRFAVEAGRNELLVKLSNADPQCLQGYMLRIRAAGKGKDVDGAFAVLDDIRKAGLKVDSLACNCVLDACVSAGDLVRGRSLMSDMKASGQLDTISYNTMLKGFCSRGDLKGSQELFVELQREGLKPDEVTYNCMINAAVSSGQLRLAWDMAWSMEKVGVAMDRFTISILLKAVKGQCAPSDVKSAMALLDRVGLSVCVSDAVLLNVALETCVKHRELRRLQNLVHAYDRSTLQPSIYTYAALIKAYSALQQVDRCQHFWRQMTEDRGMEPNEIVLGCMLDSLVCNNYVSEAVALFRQWKPKVGANMIIYSTIIKGFAIAGRAQEAMDMWREIRAEGASMNVVVYNSLIDAQARTGAMNDAHELLAGMAEDGLTPDGITHSTMVKGYCTRGDIDKAFEIFREAHKAGLTSDCVVYNTLLDNCTKHSRMELADQVLAHFERNNVRASNFTLGILVKMYGRRRQLGKAFEVVDDFAAKHKLTPNMQVRSCLMSVCINNGALDRALSLFADIKRDSDRQVDAKTCDNLLSGLMRAGRLSECIDLVEEAYSFSGSESRLLPPGQHLGVQGLDRLLSGLRSRGMSNEGATLAAGLRAKGVSLSGREPRR